MARPKGASRKPGVIVLHDDLGLNSRFRELAHQFAEAGFVALAPHLPSRVEDTSVRFERAASSTAVVGSPSAQTVEELTISVRVHAKRIRRRSPTRISAVGVGWGEYRVWTAGESNAGALPRCRLLRRHRRQTTTDCARMQTPVLGHYAELDYLITARVLKTKQLLGSKFTYYIYPTVPGFSAAAGRLPADRGLGDLTAERVAARLGGSGREARLDENAGVPEMRTSRNTSMQPEMKRPWRV